MYQRYNLTHSLLASVIVLGLTPLMAVVEAQAQIAFVSQRNGNPEIYVMDADGRNQRNLTNNPKNDWDPSWSPDGRWILFSSDRDGHVIGGGSAYEIYVMNADGGNPQNLSNNPNNDRYPSWSPNGERIAFASWDGIIKNLTINFEIYVMHANGDNPQNLTNNPFDDRYPSWSPDGEQITFVSKRDGHFIGDLGITDEIYVMDADGMNQQRLTDNHKNDWHPAWSPDGKQIAFASDRKGDFENFEIYVMDADGQNRRKLTENRQYDWDPSWSPDGERIAFMSERDGNSEIYVMDADGGNPQNLTNNPHRDGSPAWYNPPFSVSPAGKKFTMWSWLKQLNQ